MSELLETARSALLSEVRARAFYCRAAESTTHDAARALFRELAELEEDHARDLAARLAEDTALEGFDAPAYVAGLESSLSASITPADADTIRSGDVHAVLRLAQRLEREARDGYHKLERVMTEPAVRRMCREMARMEERHLHQLQEMERRLEAGGNARSAS
jgi:rubrerythrin